MRKTKKFLALALATGLMLSSMTVFAEEENNTPPESEVEVEVEETVGPKTSSYSGGTVMTSPSGIKQFEGSKPGADDDVAEGDFWYDGQSMKQWNGSAWVDTASGSSSSSSSSQKREEDKVAAALAREGALLLSEAIAEGFVNGAEMQYAQDASKSAGEYYNNAVVTTPGIENATPVAQGGKLVIDGKVTNATATISKVSVAFVDSAKSATDGTVLNVVNVQFPSVEAIINFYMPGIADGASVEALQYTDGAWANVEVAEVRADHVTLNLKGNGVVAFIAK